MSTKYSVNKIDAATEQLDWSIKLVLDHKAFIPAITLAGAAEEIIGEAVNEKEDSSFISIKKKVVKEFGISEPVASQEYLNKAKNWLKHWKDLKDEENIDLELEIESIQYILRAISNLVCHDRSVSSETPRFIKWLEKNHKDIVEGLDFSILHNLND